MTIPIALTRSQRYTVLVCALLAWMGAGLLLAMPPLTTLSAVESMGVLESTTRKAWFPWYVAAFLFGAAAGGFPFGAIGDRFGRAKALGLSVLTYSLLSGACYFVQTPQQLLVIWFLACTGVGGVWPNGVSLASEAFPGMSRPWLSGVFGTAANLGLMLMAFIASRRVISVEDWRWVMLVCASPALLGVFILLFLPESPMWLRRRHETPATSQPVIRTSELFRPPLLKVTLLGVLLATVPMTGNWGATNWLVPWAKEFESDVHALSAWTQWYKSAGAAVGGLLGGWLANQIGRRTAYFLISLASLAASYYIFHSLTPLHPNFLAWVFTQGVFCTLYFGWMPLYFPELFPTNVRAAGTGAAFNWGRIVSGVGVLMGAQLLGAFDGDFSRVGQVTCLIYAMGMIIICFAPDTSQKRLEE